MKTFLGVILLITVSQCLAEKVRYDNYKLFRVVPNDTHAFELLKTLQDAVFSGYNFWTPISSVGVPVEVMVPPYHINEFTHMLETIQMEHELLIENVQEHIDAEGLRPETRAGTFGWTNYHTLDEINSWLLSLAQNYPSIVTLIRPGTTYEGREILGVKVSFSPRNENRAIFMEAGIHAREWISPAVNTWILNEILTSSNSTVRKLVEDFDWYFFPVFNADGFVYTHTTNRMWRKTRVPYSILCYGADPNRNWAYHWNAGGSSALPCSETYAGPHAFSEPSTIVMSTYISTIAPRLKFYLSFHSYSQLLLLPYGHTAEHLDNYDELMYIGNRAADALAKRYGTKYVVGNIVETIYVASGGSMDWVKGNYQTPITYTYELRDTGNNGFLLPASQIIPTGLETFDSIISMIVDYKELHD